MVSTIVASLLGGGFVGGLLTWKAQKKKADAEAKGADASAESTELDNVEKAIKIWRDIAESLKNQRDDALINYEVLVKEVSGLKKSIRCLTATNQKILRLLASISHENFEIVAKEIQDEIEKADKQDV